MHTKTSYDSKRVWRSLRAASGAALVTFFAGCMVPAPRASCAEDIAACPVEDAAGLAEPSHFEVGSVPVTTGGGGSGGGGSQRDATLGDDVPSAVDAGQLREAGQGMNDAASSRTDSDFVTSDTTVVSPGG